MTDAELCQLLLQHLALPCGSADLNYPWKVAKTQVFAVMSRLDSLVGDQQAGVYQNDHY